MKRKIAVIGGSGLVGAIVVRNLRSRPDIEVLNLVRTPREPQDVGVDFESLASDPAIVLSEVAGGQLDAAISCIGTTIRKAGSEEAMRRIDLDYVDAFAKGAAANGARQFILVSSVGAGGGRFYLKTKGYAEAAVRSAGFSRVDIIRPGLIIGPRNERRPAEAFAQSVLPWLDPLLVGPLSQYRTIKAETIAAAIVNLTRETGNGQFVHANASIRHFAAISN